MKTIGMQVYIHSFLTSALEGGQWSWMRWRRKDLSLLLSGIESW